jgi:hypothetical protein
MAWGLVVQRKRRAWRQKCCALNFDNLSLLYYYVALLEQEMHDDDAC